jgi:hypothetical protein
MTRVGKAVVLIVIAAFLAALGVVSVSADPIHVPGGPRLTSNAMGERPAVGSLAFLPWLRVGLESFACCRSERLACDASEIWMIQLGVGFTPIHVPGGP